MSFKDNEFAGLVHNGIARSCAVEFKISEFHERSWSLLLARPGRGFAISELKVAGWAVVYLAPTEA
jgi:hypothetical protein